MAASANVVLHLAELAYGERPFEVTGIDPLDIQLRTSHELWHKEKVGKFHAALLRTGDDKLLMLDDYGNLSLIEPNARGANEIRKVWLQCLKG